MGLGKKTIDDENYAGKRVLVRCDFNVPMKDGVITNDNRINAALPTIKKLIADGAKVILCSHLGKPKNGPEAKFSLAPVAVRLSEKLGFETVIPAFIVSELKRAFQMGFLIFIPFLVIDLVVSSTLMAMGMMMLPPAMISLPFKIILFVLVDGWQLMVGTIVNSYNL